MNDSNHTQEENLDDYIHAGQGGDDEDVEEQLVLDAYEA